MIHLFEKHVNLDGILFKQSKTEKVNFTPNSQLEINDDARGQDQ